MATERWWHGHRQLIRAGLIFLQWLVLTAALGAIIVRTEQTFDGLISPRYDSSSVFIGAFVAALLLGLTIDSPKILAAAVALLCIGSALLFVIVLYIPAWEGVILRTEALDNFAIDRSLVLTLLMFLPAAIGGLGGYFLGGLLNPRQEVLVDTQMSETDRTWWLRRRDEP